MDYGTYKALFPPIFRTFPNLWLFPYTDDPIDSLEYHIKTRESGFEIKMLPTWRPDKAMAVEVPADFRAYVEKLSEVSGVTISSFDDMVVALRKRHDFFAEQGCRLSDHGIEEFYAEDYTDVEIKTIFNKVYGGIELTKEEILKFKSAMLVIFGEMDWEKGWTQQFHYGAIRNNNTKMFKLLGPDTGFDSIGEFTTAKAMAKFLDRFENQSAYLRSGSKDQVQTMHSFVFPYRLFDPRTTSRNRIGFCREWNHPGSYPT